MTVETHLRDAAVALAEGRDVDGFQRLLFAYREGGRTDELAAAIVTVAARVGPRHPDDPHLGAAHRYESVRDVFAFNELRDPTYALWSDPRVEAIAMRWLEEARFSMGPEAAAAYDRIVQSLSGGGAPAIVSRLVALFERVRSDASHPLRRDGNAVLRSLARAATKLRPPLLPLSDGARRLVGAIVRGEPPPLDVMAAVRSGDELLAAVWADPESDGPRLVYADWLIERGDRHGELIVLQCERARRGVSTPDPRETALLAECASSVLGALAPGLSGHPAHLRVERGFVAAGHLGYRPPGEADPLVRVIGHPAWATVEELFCEGSYQREVRAAPLLLDGALRSLRKVHGLAFADAQRVAEGELSSLRWTHIGIAGRDEGALLELVARFGGLATIESLSLGWLRAADLDAVLATPLGRRLQVLAVDGPEPLAEWAAAAERLLARPPLAELRLESGLHRVAFRRHRQGGLALTAALGPYGHVAAYVEALQRLAPDACNVTSLTLLRPPRRKKDKDARILEPLKAAFGARLAIAEWDLR